MQVVSFIFCFPDSSLSVDDLLGQYSPGVKRHRPETPPTSDSPVSKEKESVNAAGLPRPRNRFATLLQWRNQSEEGTGEQGTRSRCKSIMGKILTTDTQQIHNPFVYCSSSDLPPAKSQFNPNSLICSSPSGSSVVVNRLSQTHKKPQ